MNATASEQKNLIRIDLGSNPELKDYFSRLPDGHVCKLEIEFSKTGMSGDMVEGSVQSIAPDDYEPPESQEKEPGGEVKPDDKSPVMVLIGAGPGGKSGY